LRGLDCGRPQWFGRPLGPDPLLLAIDMPMYDAGLGVLMVFLLFLFFVGMFCRFPWDCGVPLTLWGCEPLPDFSASIIFPHFLVVLYLSVFIHRDQRA